MCVTIIHFCNAFRKAADDFSRFQVSSQGFLSDVAFVDWAGHGTNPVEQVRSVMNRNGLTSVFPRLLDQMKIVSDTITSLGLSFKAAQKLCNKSHLGALARLIQETERNQRFGAQCLPSPSHAQK